MPMTKPTRRLTAKQRVLKRWPKAWWSFCSKGIYPNFNLNYTRTIGEGPTPRQAWADASRRLNKGETR